MTRRVSLFLLWVVLGLSSAPVAAQNQLIVRDSLGLGGLQFTCWLLGCSVTQQIDGPLGQVFLVTTKFTNGQVCPRKSEARNFEIRNKFKTLNLQLTKMHRL